MYKNARKKVSSGIHDDISKKNNYGTLARCCNNTMTKVHEKCEKSFMPSAKM